MEETFATCLNKNGYWLSSVSFWNALLAQLWPQILNKEESICLKPEICDNAVRTAMDFFTFRFLYGASVLCADLRKKTWQRARPNYIIPKESRCNVAAALLLKASPGICITPRMAARAAPMFRMLLHGRSQKAKEAGVRYLEALKYLCQRGFGVMQDMRESQSPMFVKWHYNSLPESCKQQLAEIQVHPVSFGLHMPNMQEAPREEVEAAAPDVAAQRTEQKDMTRGIEEEGKPQTDSEKTSDNGVAGKAGPSKDPDGANPPHVQEDGDEDSEPEADVSGDEDEDEDPFTLLGSCAFHGAIEYWNVREHVEEFLGERKDLGVYSFHQQRRKQGIVLFAHCKKSACEKCTRHVKAVFGREGRKDTYFCKRKARALVGAKWRCALECG